MATSIRTLSQLPEISANQFQDISYLEASIPVAVSVDLSGGAITPIYKYASRKIKQSEFAKTMTNHTFSELKYNTGIDGSSRSQNFGQMYEDYKELLSGDMTFLGTKTFVENPILLNDSIVDFQAEEPNYIVSLSAMKRYVNVAASPAIGPNYGFVTHLSGNNGTEILDRTVSLFKIDFEQKKIEDSPSYVFSPDVAKSVSQNEYIFKIEREKRESKPWIAPATGIFTCYGWLDEMDNDKVSNENRWVALLGKQNQLGTWNILQVQPFIKNSYLSYVGFTFPVRKGMELKVQTGFAVGSNSDKYFRSTSSLANHVANAFLGGIYTALSADFGNLDVESYKTVTDSRIETLESRIAALEARLADSGN